MDVAGGRTAAGRRRLVQLCHQGAHLGHTGRVGGAQDQRVAARLGNQRGLERGVRLPLCGDRRGTAAPVDQARHQRREVSGDGVAQRDHFHIAGVGDIHGRHDARQALQVVSVIGDHQRVVAGVHVDGVVGADQRTQHRHQVVGALEVELEDLGDDLAAAGHLAARAALGDAHACRLAAWHRPRAPPCRGLRPRPRCSSAGASAARNCWKAAAGETARSVTRLSWPFTRGSTTTLRPVMVAMVRATASISALAKFRVTGSPARTLPVPVSMAVWAIIWPLAAR